MIVLALLLCPVISLAAPEEALMSILEASPENLQASSETQNALETLKQQGIINNEPDIVADYNHIYITNKPLPVLGGVLLALDHEYLEDWIGCCVNPGMALVLQVQKDRDDTTALASFAKENHCKVIPFEQSFMTKDLKEAAFDHIKKDDILVISCKLSDRNYESRE
tara:strand:+ start:3073 stop:3573 length:501 start_codon:yes stop_codon:yes gene_type:complete